MTEVCRKMCTLVHKSGRKFKVRLTDYEMEKAAEGKYFLQSNFGILDEIPYILFRC